jgi:aspartate racemase
MDFSRSFLILIGLFLIIGTSPSFATVPNGVSSINGTGCPDLHERYLDDPSMKTIGMIGGIGWSSSAVYYQLLNEMVNQRMGGDFSATILLYSIDFETFSEQERLAMEGDWDVLRGTMVDAARRLKNGGADFIIICSNTMHSTAEDITRETGLAVVHIVDATGRKIQEKRT